MLESLSRKFSNLLRAGPESGPPPKIEIRQYNIHDQTESPLFRLPLEIRQAIYHEILDRPLHIISSSYLNFVIAPCVSDHDMEGPDELQISEKWGGRVDRLWIRRLRSSWCNHWRCEERLLDKDGQLVTKDLGTSIPLPDMLLACKRM